MRYEYGYYTPTYHLLNRYRQRMCERVGCKKTARRIKQATMKELARRANYMLLFSIHGRPGKGEDIEVRYYFDWNIVIDNRKRTIITMYIDHKRPVPSADLFGNRRLRKVIYDMFFKPNSKVYREVYA